MSIVYVTAGAAGMYCGSCMHDNSLAKALIGLGEDCLLVPVYTPIRTDEESVSIDQVFYGGINVFLQQKLPWLAYLPRWLDSALNRPGLIKKLTARAMETDPRLLGALTVSMLRGMQGNQRKELTRLSNWLEKEIHPTEVLLTNMLIAGCLPEIKRRTSAKCFVTLQGDDIFIESLPDPYREQAIQAMQKLVPMVDGFVVHSHAYGRKMADMLAIPDDQWKVIPLGLDIRDFQKRVWTKQSGPLTVGYLARMASEKGLDLLVDAFIAMRQRCPELPVRLELAGWKGPQHEAYWQEQVRKLQVAGLENDYAYHGDVDRQKKLDFLGSLDLLCVPTRYEEPKGLFVLEAAATGLPYLLPDHGAFPEVHQRLQHGSLYSHSQPAELTLSLERSLRGIQSSYEDRDAQAKRMQRQVDLSEHAKELVAWMRS